jgi:hypothetical protein
LKHVKCPLIETQVWADSEFVDSVSSVFLHAKVDLFKVLLEYLLNDVMDRLRNVLIVEKEGHDEAWESLLVK